VIDFNYHLVNPSILDQPIFHKRKKIKLKQLIQMLLNLKSKAVLQLELDILWIIPQHQGLKKKFNMFPYQIYQHRKEEKKEKLEKSEDSVIEN